MTLALAAFIALVLAGPLIGLFDGFVIITAIDLGAPGWLVGVPAILGVVGGNLAVDAVKGRPRTASSS
ncbi:MAG TPA: hypothetical protein VGQ78_05895 [Vicinamibacteria bacterium]|jgi:hypothetical protein|nr:hypothetical protein [Vicinamibacteria bacterium]